MIFEEVLQLFYTISWQENTVQSLHIHTLCKIKPSTLRYDFFLIVHRECSFLGKESSVLAKDTKKEREKKEKMGGSGTYH